MLTPFNLIIPAAGSARRMQSAEPKQFMLINNKTVLEHAINAFLPFKPNQIVVAVHVDYIDQTKTIIKHIDANITCIVGGETRKDSVQRALLVCDESHYTLIHDAARPCVQSFVIKDVLEKLRRYPCVIPAIPVTDTLKQRSGQLVEKTVDRSAYVRVQTPQGFHTTKLLNAYKVKAKEDVTDEAYLMELMGEDVYLSEGDSKNVKITFPEDLLMVRQYLVFDHQSN